MAELKAQYASVRDGTLMDEEDTRREVAWKRPAMLGLALLALIVLVVAGYSRLPLFASSRLPLSDPGSLRALAIGWGPWGALALIGLQVAQVVLAPVPGYALGLVGGYLYGPWLGTLIDMTGVMIGSGIALWLARRFGRPLVLRWVSGEWLDRLDGLAKRRGPAVFFLIFLFPFLPDDAACFVAGLSPLPLGELLLLVFLGRLPGTFVSNWLGAQAGTLSVRQWVAIILLMTPIAVAFWHWQDSIESRLLRLLERMPGQRA